MRARQVPDVCHRLAAILGRPGHSPARHDELALAAGTEANDGRKLIGEYGRQRRQIAGAIVPHAEKVADGRLALGDAVEVAHGSGLCSNRP